MTNKKIYGIKKKYFKYEGDYYYFIGESPKYFYLFSNPAAARQQYTALEIAACRDLKNNEVSLDYYLLGDDDEDWLWQKREEIMPQVQDLFLKYFNRDLTLDEDYWLESIGQHLALPEEATDEQIEEIRKLLNINFYNFYEFEQQNLSAYYNIQFNETFFPKIIPLSSDENGLWEKELKIDWLFFEEAEAYEVAIHRLEYIFRSSYPLIKDDEEVIPGFVGTYSTLSDTPELLKTTLAEHQYFGYDEGSQSIVLLPVEGRINKSILKKEIENLVELLKVKPFAMVKHNFD